MWYTWLKWCLFETMVKKIGFSIVEFDNSKNHFEDDVLSLEKNC